MNREWSVTGFMKDMAYTAHIPGLLDNYMDKFPGAENLIVNLVEVPVVGQIPPRSTEPIVISDD